MQVEGNCCIRSVENCDEVCMGVFYKNGVFDETPDNCGISYALDALLYENLCGCDIDASVRTNYGFSEIVARSSPEDSVHCLECVLKTLFQHRFVLDDFEEWRAYISERPLCTNWETHYDQQRFPGTRLAHPIRGIPKAIHDLTVEDVSKWRRRYITKSNLYFCLSGAISRQLEKMLQETAYISLPIWRSPFQLTTPFPLREPVALESPNCLVLSYPVSKEDLDLMQLESFCELIRLSCSSTLRMFDTTMHYPMILMSPLKEFRIKLNCTPQNASDLETAIHADILGCLKHLDEKNLARIKRKLNKSYTSLREDLYEWTCFAGWNMSMGPWCNLVALHSDPHYFNSITGGMLEAVFARQSWKKRTIRLML